MARRMTVTFLGTTSGGGPTETRNCSSLVLDALGGSALWMVDCAEGTVRQFAQQPFSDDRRVKMGKLSKIFITHMHADHTMGLITILRNVLGMPTFHPFHDHPSVAPARVHTKPKVEVYGPAGIRAFVRNLFNLTHTRSASHYSVHELLMSNETPSAACDPPELLHPSEEPGEDIFAGEDGFWKDVAEGYAGSGGGHVVVDAGPIIHRDPCIGYVFRERFQDREHPDGRIIKASTETVPRTVVILGDTCDPSALIPLLANGNPVSLLIHEATDAYIPTHIDKYGTTGKNRTEASVKAKAIEKGHSTPAMAGEFARKIGAERLVLNHIGARFPAPVAHPRGAGEKFRARCMKEIERQATEAWNPPNGAIALAADDFCIVEVSPRPTGQGLDFALGETSIASNGSIEIEEGEYSMLSVESRFEFVEEESSSAPAAYRHHYPRDHWRGRGGFASGSHGHRGRGRYEHHQHGGRSEREHDDAWDDGDGTSRRSRKHSRGESGASQAQGSRHESADKRKRS